MFGYAYFILSGKTQQNLRLAYEEQTQIDGSCGFVLKNELWVAGGWGNNGANRRQAHVFNIHYLR